MCVTAWVGNQIGRLRVQTAENTDVRIRLMNEIVNGIKVIYSDSQKYILCNDIKAVVMSLEY